MLGVVTTVTAFVVVKYVRSYNNSLEESSDIGNYDSS